MNRPENQKMLYDAFINLGIYLPLDGSQDGDVSTLQRQETQVEHEDIPSQNPTLTELKDRITIPIRNDVRSTDIRRERTPLDAPYNIDIADELSRVHELPPTVWSKRVEDDCVTLNRSMLRQFREDMARDLVDTSNPEPRPIHMITPLDVECLIEVVTDLFGEGEAQRLCTDIIGIPIRNKKTGLVVHAASDNPRINWGAMSYPVERAEEPDAIETAVLADLGNPHDTDSDSEYEEVTAADIMTEERLHIEERVRSINSTLSPTQISEEARGTIGFTALRPADLVTPQHVEAFNWAKRRGGELGKCAVDYERLAICFQRHVEQNGAWFYVDWYTHKRRNGTCH